MTTTEKFSQFQGPSPIANGDIVVGLRDVGGGVLKNYQFTGVGSGGGGGGVTQKILQGNTFALGDWVRVDVTTMVYVKAQADTAEHGEVLGIVIERTASEFTIQQAGYIDPVLGATLSGFGNGFGGLTIGEVYFLDTGSQGAMVPNDATVNGQVSRPVFVADGPNSGWVVPYRGLIVGGAQPGGNPAPTTDTSIVVVNQNGHGLNQGDVVRVDTQNLPADPIKYVQAKADTLANAQAVGVVVSPNPQNPNQFTLQFSGYNSGAIISDDVPANIKPATVYYLSPTTAGRVTDVNPTLLGQISKPIYISEQGQINFGVSAGYIMPQRPLSFPTISNNTHTVQQVNNFNKGEWVYIDADGHYARAQANTLDSSQVSGVVISDPDPNQFTVQQSGFINNVVVPAFVDGPLNSAQLLYLSPTMAGKITATQPNVVGQFIKPCYVQETAAGRIGEILPQIALPVTGPVVPGTGWTVISTQNIVNQAACNITGITGFYRYRILLENVIPVNNSETLMMRTSSNNGASYDSAVGDYEWAGSSATTSDTKLNLTGVYTGAILVSNTALWGGVSGFIDFINPAQLTSYKFFIPQVIYSTVANLVVCQQIQSGARKSNAVINAARIYFNANIASGTIKLLGTNS